MLEGGEEVAAVAIAWPCRSGIFPNSFSTMFIFLYFDTFWHVAELGMRLVPRPFPRPECASDTLHKFRLRRG